MYVCVHVCVENHSFVQRSSICEDSGNLHCSVWSDLEHSPPSPSPSPSPCPETCERLCFYRNNRQQQAQPNFSWIPTQSWYPPSVLSQSGLHRASSSPNIAESESRSYFQSGVLPEFPSNVFAATFLRLKNKSVEELRKLVTDKAAYNELLHSLDLVRTLDILDEELKKSNIELARKNLEQESIIAELQNQCAIIRTSDLPAALEDLSKVQKLETDIKNRLSIPTLLERLQEVINQADEQSEELHKQLLSGEIELLEFIPKYRRLRSMCHRWTLTYSAAKFSMGL